MRKYDSYKDSGVEWVDFIPQHWNLTPFDKVLDEVKLKYGHSDDHLNLLSLSGENGIYFKGYEDEIQIRSKEELENYNVVREGQIVLNPLVNPLKLDYFGFSVSGIQGVVSPVYMVFETSNTPKYLEWYFKSHLTIQYLLSNTKGVRPLSLQLSRDSLKGIKVIIPPLSEQSQIVSFLDTKTSLIDSLIEKTQRKIELLKEKRTSLINEVVTKGLNPNVEMKDSCVEWIGEIPDNWGVTKMKYVGDYLNGYPFKPTDWGDEGRLIIRIQNLTEGRGSENFYSGEIDPKYIVRTGDYLFSWSTTLGLYEWKRDEGLLNQHIFKVELNDILFKKYYFWVIQGVIKELSNESHGSTMTHLTKDVFGNIRLPLPPLSEQSQIVSYLDEQTQLIDKTISIEKKRIELLKEYRQSLISEVVTGKRKVVE